MSIERKVQEALKLGVPMRDINRVLQNNAMKAKDPAVRQQLMNAGGAVRKFNGGSVSFSPGSKPNIHVPAFKKGPISWDPGGPIGGPGAGARGQALAARNAKAGAAMTAGGLRTLGSVQQNLAGGIGQAGLKNQAFTPTSSLEGVAGGVEGRGAAEAAYQGDLANISRQEYEDKIASENLQHERDRRGQERFEERASPIRKELKALEDGNDLLEVTASKAETMARYVQEAGPAWEVFRKNSSVERLTGLDDWQNYITGAGGSQIDTQTAFLVQEGLNSVQSQVGKPGGVTQAHSNAVSNVISALDDLATAALKAQGPGVKTNFDFMVARQTITNLQANANQVVSSINAFIKRVTDQIARNNAKIQELTDEMDGLAAGFGLQPNEQTGGTDAK